MLTEKRQVFHKEIMAPTLIEGITKVDEWHKSMYDMTIIEYEHTEHEGEPYVRIRLFGWENSESREYLYA